MEADKTLSTVVYACFPKLNAIWNIVFVNNKDSEVHLAKDKTGHFVMKYPTSNMAIKVVNE